MPSNRDPAADAYRQALLYARRRGFQINREGVERLYAAFAEALSRIAEEAGTEALSADRAEALRQQFDMILRALNREMVRNVERSAGQSAVDVAEIHRTVTRELVRRYGEGGRAAAGIAAVFDRVPLRAVQTMVARQNAATFQTLVGRHIRSLAPEIDTFLESAVARGVSAGRAAKDLARIMARGPINTADAAAFRRALDRIDASDLHRGAGTIDFDAYGLEEVDTKALRSLLYDARRIQVTETNLAYRAAEDVSMQESPLVEAAQLQLSGAHPKPDICDVLASQDAYGYGPGFYPPGKMPLAIHPHCFLPGTLVQGSFTAALRSQYSGKAVEIVTRQGNRLRVTPNHPILTEAGFLRAGSVCVGDRLVSYRGVVDGAPAEGPHDAPAPIEDVFSALAEAAPIASAERSPEYLHGDAVGVQGDIDVVRADWILLPDRAARTDGIGDLVFVRPAIEEVLVGVLGAPDLLLERNVLAAPPLMRSPDDLKGIATGGLVLLPPLAHVDALSAPDLHARAYELALEGGPRHSRLVGEPVERLSGRIPLGELREIGMGRLAVEVGPGQDIDAALLHPAGQDASADTEFRRELADRFSALVTSDVVVEVRDFDFAGHVYDLESSYGFIIASGIFSSNCMCSAGRVQLRRPSEWGKAKPAARPLSIDPSDERHTAAWADQWTENERERYQQQFAAILAEGERLQMRVVA